MLEEYYQAHPEKMPVAEKTITTDVQLQSTTGQSSSGQSMSIEELSYKDHLQVENPLFRYEERPDVLDIMYQDCISSYASQERAKDIYS